MPVTGERLRWKYNAVGNWYLNDLPPPWHGLV